MSSTQNLEAQPKVAQLYKALCDCSDPASTKQILEQLVDVYSQIPGQYFLVHSESNRECTTLLHVAYAKGNIENFKLLLQYGADFTFKDQCGSTILHCIVKDNQQLIDSLWKPVCARSFIYAVLSAHVDSGNYANPCDVHGLSHFHVAAVMDNVGVIELFLSNDIPVDHVTNMDSPLKPGYGPLHFAVENYCLETVQLLISNGANMHLKNANGMTPLHLLIERRLEEFLDSHTTTGEEYLAVVEYSIEATNTIINIFLENNSTDIDCTDHIGLSKFHVACTLQEHSVLECLLDQIADINQPVNADSPVWPGYTGLHFAAYCDVETMRILIERGANMMARDAKGTTPLDICMKWFKIEDMYSVLDLLPELQSMTFSNERTKLLDWIFAVLDSDKLKEFLPDNVDLNTRLPEDSPVWPGKTALHLAIKFERTDPAVALIMSGADINVVDSSGKSAFSHIFEFPERSNYCNSLSEMIALHVHKLKLIGVEVSKLNESLLARAIRERFISLEDRSHHLVGFRDKVSDTENVKIGRRGLTLRNFLRETAAISFYPSLTPEERDEVIAFFESLNYKDYRELKFAIKLQYRKIVQRVSLSAAAEKSFKALLDFPLPDLCVEIVLKFLGNSDLISLIATLDHKDEKMMVD